MWEHRCDWETRKGTQCKRQSTMAIWVHSFQGWKATSGPSWFEVCGHHYGDAPSAVAMLEIAK